MTKVDRKIIKFSFNITFTYPIATQIYFNPYSYNDIHAITINYFLDHDKEQLSNCRILIKDA